jgi:hypothetical protein
MWITVAARVGRGTHSPSGVDPRGAPRRMTRFWARPGLNPAGAGQTYDQSALPVARSTYTDQSAPPVSYRVFPVHTSGGASKQY